MWILSWLLLCLVDFGRCSNVNQIFDEQTQEGDLPAVMDAFPFERPTRLFSQNKIISTPTFRYNILIKYQYNTINKRVYIYTDSFNESILFKYVHNIWRNVSAESEFDFDLCAEFMNLTFDALQSISQACLPFSFVYRMRHFNATGDKGNLMSFFLLSLVSHAIKVASPMPKAEPYTRMIQIAVNIAKENGIMLAALDEIIAVLNASYGLNLKLVSDWKDTYALSYEIIHLIYMEQKSLLNLSVFDMLWNTLKQLSLLTTHKYLSIIYQHEMITFLYSLSGILNCKSTQDACLEHNDNILSVSDCEIIEQEVGKQVQIIEEFSWLQTKTSPHVLCFSLVQKYRQAIDVLTTYALFLSTHQQSIVGPVTCIKTIQKMFVAQYIYFLYSLAQESGKQDVDAAQLLLEYSDIISSHRLIDQMFGLLAGINEANVDDDLIDNFFEIKALFLDNVSVESLGYMRQYFKIVGIAAKFHLNGRNDLSLFEMHNLLIDAYVIEDLCTKVIRARVKNLLAKYPKVFDVKVMGYFFFKCLARFEAEDIYQLLLTFLDTYFEQHLVRM